SVLYLKGQTYNTYIKGVSIDGAGLAKTGLFLESFINNRFVNIDITGFTENGLKILAGGKPTGNYNIYNRFESINVTANYDGTNALYMDGVYELSNDTWISSFANCSFDASDVENGNGAYMKFVDSISLYMCKFLGSAAGMVFDARGNNDFPCGMGFYDCSLSSTQTIESNSDHIRKHYFYGYGTLSGEQLPDNSKLFGVTDTGELMSMDSLMS
ncbi:MAG TPA: hypothetical protein PLT66_05225, partial [Bacillota bacterium]|nr:hypothetical protein [Bacillota bacterium]